MTRRPPKASDRRPSRAIRRLAIFVALAAPLLAVVILGDLAAAFRSETRERSRTVAPLPAALAPAPATGGAFAGESLVREAARGVAPAGHAGSTGLIELSNGYRFDPIRDGEPAFDPAMKAKPQSASETGAYLVQLAGQVQDAERRELAAAGVALVSYIPSHTYLVRMQAGARDAVESLPFVRWVGAYHPAYKMSALPEMKGAGAGEFVVLLFPDAVLDAARSSMTSLGGSVLEATDSGRNKIVRVSVDRARLDEIAARSDVAWIEPWYELHATNNQVQWVVQTNTSESRRVWDMGLRGQGQVVHTSDSGIRTSHNQFRDDAVSITTWGDYPTHRKVIAYHPAVLGSGILFGDASGASYHGTHTAGTIVGDDSPHASDARDGMAPAAKIYFHDAGAGTNSIIAPGDLNLLFQPAYDGNAGGAARISSNSWGGNAAGAYTVHSMTADQFAWDHKDFLINFSNGNAGPQPATVGSPASFKNGISSGATQNGALAGSMMPLSSQGPAADLRLKPTLLAPGMSIQSANGANDTGYQALTGTSMSCPSGAGALALVRQYLVEGWYPTGTPTPANGFVPSGALIKAIAVASPDNDMTAQLIPNNVIGWGRIKLDNVLYFPGDAARLAVVDQNEGLTTGEFIEYDVHVASSAVPLRIALCWFDKEGHPAAARALVNDLDLTATDPLNLTYQGNVFAGGQSVPGGLPDTLNVEEVVRLDAPATGLWKIRVSTTNAPFSPQPFALAISGAVGGTNGTVTVDRTTYGRDDVVQIRVEDLNAASVSVQVSSTTEGTGETVALSGSAGVFTGSIATTALAPSGGDGMISLSHGDAITVSYVDADPAGAVDATAIADFEGPAITDVSATEDDIVVLVRWETDAHATSRVHYGTSPALGQTADDANLVASHAVLLDGLLPETTYYFDVESEDGVGNTTRDDAGGAHYRFTTGTKGDILLVIGDDSFGQLERYRSALASKGWDATVLKGGTIENPVVGDMTAGLRSYTAVWWQVGQEQYPPVPDAARDSLTRYLDGGGRLSFVAHDAGWAFTDPASGFHTPAREAWLASALHIDFLEDPLTWPANQGVAGDPISAGHTLVQYSPHRDGAAGDEIALVAGTGTGAYVWRNTDATAGDIGLRWQNNTANGDPDGAVWGGTPTKLVTNCFEWAQIVDAAARDDILDKTLIWLIGHDHPDVAVGSPNGGEVLTGESVEITWTETAYAGQAIASRSIEYSSDGGASWAAIAASAGPPPYTWSLAGLPNSNRYLVRVRVTDDASPALRGNDASDAVFRIDRPGGDTHGPAVAAGSVRVDPNPIDNRNASTLTADLTDTPFGGSDVTAAEWSRGPAPAAPGEGAPMSGAFDASEVSVTATLAALTVPTGEQTFWVRGRDAAGNWGNAASLVVTVNGDQNVDVDGSVPAVNALAQNSPNPFNPTTAIRFTIANAARVDLVVYDVRGARVRTLVSGEKPAGQQTVYWDGRDDAGRPVASGVYVCRLASGSFRDARKMILLK